MFKVLTQSGIFQTTSEQTARTMSVNAARSGESVVLVTTSDEYIIKKEPRGAVMAYSVSDARAKSSNLMDAYREVCFRAYAAEEEKAKKAAADAARKAQSSKTSKTSGYAGLGSDWMEETFNHVFGGLMGLAKK